MEASAGDLGAQASDERVAFSLQHHPEQLSLLPPLPQPPDSHLCDVSYTPRLIQLCIHAAITITTGLHPELDHFAPPAG